MIKHLALASVISSIGIALSAGAASAELPSAPAGWVKPSDADLQGPNWNVRQAKPNRDLRAEADFNGDGKADAAELLVNRRDKTYALYAFLDGAKEPVQIVASRLEFLPTMGLSVAKPGKFETACSKGLDRADPKCERGEKFITTKLPSISYFMYGASSDQLYWDGSKFIQVWSAN
jgi:hypothetical protein